MRKIIVGLPIEIDGIEHSSMTDQEKYEYAMNLCLPLMAGKDFCCFFRKKSRAKKILQRENSRRRMPRR